MGIIRISLLVVFLLVTYTYLKRVLNQELPLVLDGTYHPAFKPLSDVFREVFSSGKERGAAFAVYHKGVCVFDMWGGYADVEAQRPWRKDTVTLAWSVSKGITAIVVATFVEKGLLDYKQPIVKYWPEFGQQDKGNITLEMLLSHQAGLVLIDEPFSIRDIKNNPDKVTAILAKQKTMWPAGTERGYHAHSWGLFVDTLIQKVDPKGRTVDQVFHQDVATPFEIDMFLNLPKDKFYRGARVYTDSIWKQLYDMMFAPRYLALMGNFLLNPRSIIAESAKSMVEFTKDPGVFNDPDVREVHMSSVMASVTARGPAKLYGILANGGVDKNGQRLLSNAAIEALTQPLDKIGGIDQVLMVQSSAENRLGRGVWVSSKGTRVLGHPGHGGQNARADLDNHLGMAYVTNYITIYGMGDHPGFVTLNETVYICLEKYLASGKGL